MKSILVICLLLAVTSNAATTHNWSRLLDTVAVHEAHHPLLQPFEMPSHIKPQWHSDSSAAFLSQARSSSQRVAAELVWWHVVALLGGGIVVGILTDRMLSSLGGDPQKVETPLGGDPQKVETPADEATETQQGDQPVDASGAAVDNADKAAEEPRKHIDYEKLLRLLSQRVMQQVGPKFAKADAVRNILEERATSIKGKAKAFLLNELNYTAADVLKAIEAEEAMVLLDWNNMIATNFPPVAVLLAGLLSPTILSLRQMSHMLQLLIGLLPILALCIWAVIADLRSECTAIPSMYLWACVTCGLALLLTLGHTVLYMKISSGKAQLSAKADEMREKLQSFQTASEESMSFTQMRELFICGSVLLQQALLVEDSARNSFWMTLTGAGSVLWLLTVIWNVVLVVGWTFVPGQVAFHPSAATVAGDDYCGALVTVFVARIVLMLQMLFFFTHIMTILNWASDLLVTSPGFAKALLGAAEKIDAGMLGVPVVQTLFKAFLLRGGSDMATSQLSLAMNTKNTLEKEHAEAKRKADNLAFQLSMANQEVVSLQAKTHGSQTADLQACMDHTEMLADDLDPAKMQEKGAKAIEDMRAQATALEEATTQELELVLEKLQELLEAIQNNESVKAAVAQALQIVEMAQEKAKDLSDQATHENIQGMLTQAQATASRGLAQAQDAAGGLDVETLQGALAQAQQLGATAAARAKEATANIDMEALQTQAQQLGATAAARAKEATANIDMETLQGAVAQAQEVGTAAAARAQDAAAAASSAASAAAASASELANEKK